MPIVLYPLGKRNRPQGMSEAKAYFEEKEGIILTPFKISIKIDYLLKEFILKD